MGFEGGFLGFLGCGRSSLPLRRPKTNPKINQKINPHKTNNARRYEAGALSPYGDEALAVLQYLAGSGKMDGPGLTEARAQNRNSPPKTTRERRPPPLSARRRHLSNRPPTLPHLH